MLDLREKKIGKKTIFNLIGPLSSPAQVKRQVVGVFDKKWMRPFAEALKENNVIHAYIVHSNDGMDEISPFAKTNVVELKDGKIKVYYGNYTDYVRAKLGLPPLADDEISQV